MSGKVRVAALETPPPPFRSGRAELDEWLARHGLRATRMGSARVFMAWNSEDAVAGYFALSAGSVDPENAGTRTRRGMPRHHIPVVLLARLAVAEDAQGGGVGRELVWHAGAITLRASGLIGIRALVVDALDEQVSGFYEHLGFTPNQANPLRLELLIKDLEQLAAEQRE